MTPAPQTFKIEAEDSAPGALVLKLSGPAGLGSVINGFKACQRSSRGFAATGISDRIATLFAVTQVDRMFPCFDSLAAAEASVGSPGK